ncbi:SGNH/GDSL hydrolase family protein [Seonamhaeicola maritimus]|uniref:SGNH/GDSL hydrolase family protein n=1 Tax=Seonamhaeicola maritimus TaxID=2591822 RepID=A0A5C7GIC2_9FLAO|nr:SGNH/GDSL hydrolase family protein [Seonamhaeicola maritimus]TXG37189.1 SGNH/GDSL hydrolase family protein [Seonamhaeicola maritimus]
MKRLLLLLFITVFIGCTKSETRELPLHNKKVLILGNSITQNGRYVDFIEYYLRKNYPEESLNIISVGLSSETASGDSESDHPFPRPWIHNRLDNALSFTKPDLVIACYGMNDGIYSNLNDTRFNNYKKGINKLKDKVEGQGANIIFLTPTIFDAEQKKEFLLTDSDSYSYKTPYAHYNKEVLKTYANWLLESQDVPVVDLHSYLTDIQTNYKKADSTFTLIPDAVHPNNMGHFYMAKKILNDLYPAIKIANVSIEFEQLKDDPLFSMVSKRRYVRSEGWREYIGYERGETIKTNDITPTINQVKALDKQISLILENN